MSDFLRRALRSMAREEKRFSSVWKAVDSVEGWLSRSEAELLFLLAGCVRPDQAIVEIGSYCGRSTTALAFGANRRQNSVFAVDPHTGDRSQVEAGQVVDTFAAFLGNIQRLGLADAVVPVRSLSVDAARTYSGPEIGLLFVDGWHSTEAVIEDVKSWQPFLTPQPIIVFDDFQFPDVGAGIAEVAALLPPRLGSVGKDLVFGPREIGSDVRRLGRLLLSR